MVFTQNNIRGFNLGSKKESNMSVYSPNFTKNLEKVAKAIESLRDVEGLLIGRAFGGELVTVIGALMLIKWDLEFKIKAIENVEPNSA
jgi:hypothetical protein